MININKVKLLSQFLRRPVFKFGGHHDIDRTKLRLRDDGNGKTYLMV